MPNPDPHTKGLKVLRRETPPKSITVDVAEIGTYTIAVHVKGGATFPASYTAIMGDTATDIRDGLRADLAAVPGITDADLSTDAISFKALDVEFTLEIVAEPSASDMSIALITTTPPGDADFHTDQSDPGPVYAIQPNRPTRALSVRLVLFDANNDVVAQGSMDYDLEVLDVQRTPGGVIVTELATFADQVPMTAIRIPDIAGGMQVAARISGVDGVPAGVERVELQLYPLEE